MKILAIDPGLKGGIASFNSHTAYNSWPMPVRRYTYYGFQKRQRSRVVEHVDVETLHLLATLAQPEVIVVEQQLPLPQQNSRSTATTFINYGIVLSLRLVAPVHIVPASSWKKAMGVPADKKLATERACELFPGLLTTYASVRNGEAEALMIALYWYTMGDKNGAGPSSTIRSAGARGKAKAVRGGFQASS